MYSRNEIIIAKYLVDTKNKSTWYRRDRKEQLISELCAEKCNLKTVDSIKNRLVLLDDRKLKAIADKY